ncbi:tail fiber protein [Nocardioides sp.]|jgi:microcystin-dependent protein|uniref:phage tail protein n=1 Tax=Nocardioides sp. TaxID=35761 RepID=UPI0031FE59B8|nr:Phage tail collar domain protein [Nocardioides sp.]
MSEAFIGEIRMFGFDFVPRNWARCDGQILQIAQYQAIFSLLGTTYGGNGSSTFALPDLRRRGPVHFGVGNEARTLGEVGGEENHTLTQAEIPAHLHVVSSRPAATTDVPSGALWAGSPLTAFGTGANTTMAPSALGTAGQSQPHPNMPPYLVITFGICMFGIFPSRS